MRITATVGKVLRVFLDDIAEPRYGFELMQQTGLASGTLYPILARLEAAGWLTSHLEDIDPGIEGRPARRFYRISQAAARIARDELAALSEQLRPPSVQQPARLRPQGGLA
ncbi:MAG TPA: helix-turn-helix transcriptional regulator [Pseudonocardiaceae bacterium]|nr:helix-turn-helix transcriptional regulator [Pseudonocardiaceae bacterium]